MLHRRAAREPTPARTLLWLMVAVLLLQCLAALPPELTTRRHHHAARSAVLAEQSEQRTQVQSVLPFKGTVRSFEWPWARQAGTAHGHAHAHDGHWHVHDESTTATPLGQAGDEAGNASAVLWLGLLLTATLLLPAVALAGRFGPTLATRWGTRTAAPPLRPPRLA